MNTPRWIVCRADRRATRLIGAASVLIAIGAFAPAAGAADLKVDFGPAGALVPTGYVGDSGAAFTTARGYGWVRQDSLSSASHVPFDMTARMRERNAVADQRLDTVAQPQTAPGSTALVPAAWEAVVPTGDYTVTVAGGDPSYLDSTHRLNVEGTAAITGFTPTSAVRTRTATVRVRVTDGRLTLDGVGGTNSKFLYIDIVPVAAPPVDTAPPAAPSAVTASAGDARVTLGWAANSESDLAGYAVYRSTTTPVPVTGAPLNGSTLLTAPAYTDLTAANGTTYRYAVVAVDAAGNRSSAAAEVSATPTAPVVPPATFPAKVNFQPDGAAPSGYVADTGQSFDAGRGYGWVRQDSLTSATHVAVDMTSRTRRRSVAADPRQDTLIQAQTAPNAAALVAGSWEVTVPNGSYAVVVGVGDPSYLDSTHRVRVEGTVALAGFVPTSANRYATARATVAVSDGRLTVDGVGGVNTKFQYVDIAALSVDAVPSGPTGLGATAGDGRVSLGWNANTEGDLAGYAVYRSTATPVPTTGAPLNGGTLITGTSFTDTTATNGTTYSYAVVAVDAAGGRSTSSNQVSATPADAVAPAAPSGLTATAGTTIGLSWSANTESDLAGYRVYRSATTPVEPNAANQLNSALVTGTAYSDATAVSGTSYSYVILAEDTSGNRSPVSGQADATLVDTEAPTAPTGLAATPGNGLVTLGWNANTQPDLAGYDLYRSTTTPVVPGVATKVNSAPITAQAYTDAGVTNGTRYYYVLVAVDTTGNRSAAGAQVDALPASAGVAPTKVNFQPASAAVPSGYTPDTGAAYSAARGFGWIREDSVASPVRVPFDVTNRVREVTSLTVTDQRQLTVLAMQSPAGTTGTVPVAWEGNVANGTYLVTVGVGDASASNSIDRIRAEGSVLIISGYAQTAGLPYYVATARVRVLDGRLTIDAIGGTNTKINYIDITPTTADTTAPAAPVARAGAGNGRVTVGWNAGETDVASYDVYRSTTSPVPMTAAAKLNSTPLTGLAYTDATAVNGTTYRYAVVATDTADNVSAKSAELAVTPSGAAETGTIAVANQDLVPSADRMMFSRIATLDVPPPNGVHDRATLRVSNSGTAPLRIDSVPFTGPFRLLDPPAFPAIVAPGSFLDLRVLFIATSGRVSTGDLTVRSSDVAAPAKTVQLAGYWQRISEQNQEPSPQELVTMAGWTTRIINTGQSLSRAGRIEAVGDEVLSPYWQRLDSSQQVGVTQLGAYHNQGNVAGMYTFARGTQASRNLVTHAGIDGQSILPRRNGSTTALAATSFIPTTAQFGFRVDSEWSDPLFNDAAPDRAAGCVTGCGHHIRFWPVKDRTGTAVPGSWIMGMDYSGINYDYQDNFYLITNISPVPQAAVPRVDAGSSTGYTEPGGRVWAPDTGLYGPFNTPAEGGATTAIAGTTDDPLYSSYRGNTGAATPQTERIFNYRIPEPGMTTVTVKLHFAERFWSMPGKRVFDVLAEGASRVSAYDIFTAAGGANTATTLTLTDVPISDGALDLSFIASVDQPAVAAIEVTCVTGCS